MEFEGVWRGLTLWGQLPSDGPVAGKVWLAAAVRGEGRAEYHVTVTGAAVLARTLTLSTHRSAAPSHPLAR
jgi:hypothetical protein